MPVTSDKTVQSAQPFEGCPLKIWWFKKKKILKKRGEQLQSIHNETGNELNNHRFFFSPWGSQTIKEMRDRKGAVMSPNSLSVCVKVFSPWCVRCKLQVSPKGMLWEVQTRMHSSASNWLHSHDRLAPALPPVHYKNGYFLTQKLVCS